MNDRFELVEITGDSDTWRINSIAKFYSLDQACQMLITLSRQFLDRHFTLCEIYD